jgi:hypothetical protein
MISGTSFKDLQRSFEDLPDILQGPSSHHPMTFTPSFKDLQSIIDDLREILQ